LFGSDFPYAPAELGGKFTAKLDADTALTDRDRAAINHENAHGLFERLRKPASA
jgi:predicted TIM-barrel fold metal-dependent hydrolase